MNTVASFRILTSQNNKTTLIIRHDAKIQGKERRRNRIYEKERDRNATTEITRNGKGTHAFLSRSFSLQFSALKLNKNDRKSQSGFC